LGTLAEALARTAKHHGPSGCKFSTIRDKLDDADRQVLDAWMAAPPKEIPGANIARALTLEGHKIHMQVVNRHRRGDCDCGTR
jgi:hypothetical protein